jgi:hypothetical protein
MNMHEVVVEDGDTWDVSKGHHTNNTLLETRSFVPVGNPYLYQISTGTNHSVKMRFSICTW